MTTGFEVCAASTFADHTTALPKATFMAAKQ